jgi:hypothetical protein
VAGKLDGGVAFFSEFGVAPEVENGVAELFE